MIIEAKITGTEIFPGIQAISEKEKVIGYLVNSSPKQESTSVVTTDGKTLGEYCCESHAVRAAFIHAHDLPAETVESTKFSMADLLLASLLKSMTRH